jgi:protein involved in polysaccharide export with SLBB domain
MLRSRWILSLISLLFLAGCASESPTAIDLDNAARANVYQVSGAVVHPGTFNLSPREDLTLAEAIRRCGGFIPGNEWNDGGNPDAVRLQRELHGSIIELTLIASPGGHDEDFIIRPGDCVVVPKRTFSTPIPNPLPYAN